MTPKAGKPPVAGNDTFEAIRLVAPKGHEICHNHQVEGMITVHCLEGRIAWRN